MTTQIDQEKITILTSENFDNYGLSECITQDAIEFFELLGFTNMEVIEIVTLMDTFKYGQCIEKVEALVLTKTTKFSQYTPIKEYFITIENALSFDDSIKRGQCMDMAYVFANLLKPYVDKKNAEGKLGEYSLGLKIRNGTAAPFFSDEGCNHVWVELYLSKSKGFIVAPKHIILDPAFKFIRMNSDLTDRVNYSEGMSNPGIDPSKIIQKVSIEAGHLLSVELPTFDIRDKHILGMSCDGKYIYAVSFLKNEEGQVIPLIRLGDQSMCKYTFYLDKPIDVSTDFAEFRKSVRSFRNPTNPEVSYFAQLEVAEMLFILNQKLQL